MKVTTAMFIRHIRFRECAAILSEVSRNQVAGYRRPTRTQDAGRRAKPLDALLRWTFLCGQVPQ